jgi:outer membrane protein
MKIKYLPFAAAGAAMALAGAARAEDFQPKAAGTIMLNVRVSDVSPVADDAVTTLAGAPTGLKVKATDSVMPTIGLTYFITNNWAVEAIAGTTQHTIKAVGGSTDIAVKDTWVLPPVVSVQYHFAPAAKFSPYLGAGVNYMIFYSGSDRNGFQVKLNNGFGAALQAGADIALHGRWSLNADVKKVFFETRARDTKNGVQSNVHLDPWVLSAGVGYKF